jgi:hypothetical protein
MNSTVRVLLAPFCGLIAAAIVTWAASKGITINRENLTTALVELITVFATVFGIVHTPIQAKVNPANVSSPNLAQEIHVDMKQADAVTQTEADHGGAG